MEARRALKALLFRSLEAVLFCNILILVNIVFVSLIAGDAVIVLSLVSSATFLEAGIGLTLAGLYVLSAGPVMTKFAEKAFHGPPYSAKRARESEGRAQVFILFSFFLLLFSYLLGTL